MLDKFFKALTPEVYVMKIPGLITSYLTFSDNNKWEIEFFIKYFGKFYIGHYPLRGKFW
jgi:hypothetical protein